MAVEDFDMWLRMTGAGVKAVRSRTYLVYYRKVVGQISTNKIMMVRRALMVIGNDYERRGLKMLFVLLRPVHWGAYVTTSFYKRYILREL